MGSSSFNGNGILNFNFLFFIGLNWVVEPVIFKVSMIPNQSFAFQIPPQKTTWEQIKETKKLTVFIFTNYNERKKLAIKVYESRKIKVHNLKRETENK